MLKLSHNGIRALEGVRTAALSPLCCVPVRPPYITDSKQYITCTTGSLAVSNGFFRAEPEVGLGRAFIIASAELERSEQLFDSPITRIRSRSGVPRRDSK